jgi:hypothetical protein
MSASSLPHRECRVAEARALTARPQACFPETGFCARGPFLAYWQAHGGLALNGYPLSDERIEVLEDGRFYQVQYFERVRLEYHPEHAAPYDVLLGQFGRDILAQADLLAGNPNFQRLYTTNEAVHTKLRQPVAPAAQVPGSTLAFERGRMVWQGDQRRIYALCGAPTAGDLVTGGNVPWIARYLGRGAAVGGGPRPGLYEPVRGFGKVWRERANVRQCLGYASAANETGFPITVQAFRGEYILLSDAPADRAIYVVWARNTCNACDTDAFYERYPVPAP